MRSSTKRVILLMFSNPERVRVNKGTWWFLGWPIGDSWNIDSHCTRKAKNFLRPMIINELL